MANPTPVTTTIVSWVQRGMASLISGTQAANHALLPISVSVNGAVVNAPSVRLLGPGDITSLDPRAVIRTDPRDGADAFEPNYLAAIEFSAPDLPWMFTPAAHVGNSLRPWICLVVLEETDGVSVTVRSDGLTVLELGSPLVAGSVLPGLDHIDAWAHAQVTGDALSGAALSTALDTPSGAHLSRLISPRKLDPAKRYHACVVPTYRAGANAALSLPVDDADLAPAWQSDTTSLTLPVYYHFRFQTGPGGDFASLAQRIRPLQAPLDAGARQIDASTPGYGVPAIPGAAFGLDGALRPIDSAPATLPADVQAALAGRLRTALTPPPSPDPVVTPPVYGRTHADVDLPADAAPPNWLRDLNLDPRRRAVASAGAQVVQGGQDALVASAWDQLGEIRKANQLLRQAQMAREVTLSLARRHLATIPDDAAYLQVTTPVHSRVRLTLGGQTATLRGHVQSSRLPTGAVSSALRRLARPRGPVGRQLSAAGGVAAMVARLNQPPGPAALAWTVGAAAAPRGLVALDDVSPDVKIANMSVAATAAGSVAGWRAAPASDAPPWIAAGAGRLPVLLSVPQQPQALAGMQEGFRKAATAIGAYLNEAPAAALDISTLQPLGGAPALTTTRAQLRASLDPEMTISARITERLPLSGRADTLSPLTAAPAFPQPMVRALTDLSTEWLLPGLSGMPLDKTELLVTNPAFVEAFMIGLNDEMSRVLLWNEFPVDARATYFQNFWGAVAAAGPAPDIPPIASFDPNGHLGDHTRGAGAGTELVLLLRAELFRRYQNAVVAAIPAVWSSDKTTRLLGDARTYPVFRGEISAELVFFGFDGLDRAAALGSDDPAAGKPGWYFVIEEHVTEPRFGLEPAASAAAGASWNKLAWGDATLDKGHLSPTAMPIGPAPREGIKWGDSAAAMAAILMRTPVRVAMHARALIRKGGA